MKVKVCLRAIEFPWAPTGFLHTPQITRVGKISLSELGGAHYSELIYDDDESYQFPLYWIGEHVAIMGYEPNKLSDIEKEAIDFLE